MLTTFYKHSGSQRLPREASHRNRYAARSTCVTLLTPMFHVGLAFLVGLDAVMTNAANFRTPIRIAHGSLDRVTDHRRSPEFINNCSSTDKQCKIYEGYQHAMLKVGYDEEDDIKRQVVLADAEKWLGERL
jgi:alpha-beta hydrolase superfamily lysophospholipase